MTSTLTIQDLALGQELDRQAMAAVRGGIGNQANATNQSNVLTAFAPLSVADGAKFSGSGPVTLQADSRLDQSAWDDSFSENFSGTFGSVHAV